MELFYTFGLGGGSSRATTGSVKPMRLWLPSQNGLFAEWPQRHNEITVLPANPNVAPVGSQISKFPSMRMGPLFRQLTLVSGIFKDRSTGCAEPDLSAQFEQ